MLAIGLAGCGADGPEQSAPAPSGEPSRTTTSDAESVTPSISRDVPPDERVRLSGIAPEELCRLVSPQEIEELAFAVGTGRPRQVGSDPVIPGCVFEDRSEGRSEGRSVLIGVQPGGFQDLGREEVDLGGRPGTQRLSAGDCTVFSAVPGGVLQVSISAAEADHDECETGQAVAQYALAGVAG
nr:DUF3558 family protein [Saccharopolyspora sp. HNM0983]